ncbi:hypothetical protein RHMOL_Rhmol11G0000300 [Rhododendron molle]|uniref:Uncharacterized protein n=1 Tax=Rhododendron molle TaxID=49168 RepID=A0ACC0LNR5_RHOML|nr:hypothetical protein RHMOL_Rhmol11G0000300 [Rhododendron molle]
MFFLIGKMTNNKVKYIKPGKMAQQVPDYERKKREKIELNHMRMVELGYHKMADALFGSYKKRKIKNTEEAKNMRARGNLSDEDYQQPEDAPEDEDDDEDTFSYTDDEELIDSMNARKKNAIASTLQTDQLPPIESTMALSLAQGSRPAPVTVAPTPTPTQDLPVEQDGLSATPSSLPQQMVRASTSTRVRGANRGINTERIIAGGSGKKLVVEIPLKVGAPIGANATRFATWLDIQIRMAAPLKNVEKWDDIPFHVKAPIIQATRDKFNIVGYDEKEHVRRGVDRKCKKLYRTWRHNMKDHYEALVEAGKDPYVNPYKGVSGEDWAWMIGNIWTNKDKEVLVLKRKKARSKVPFNHTMASQSFASAMAAQTHKRGGQRPHIADFYYSTHYSLKKKKWVAPICEQLHLLLEARQKEDEARCQEVDALGLPITMPQEEMPIEVLAKKFYVKEYGVSLKSSSSKRSSGQSHEEVRVLKNEFETLKDVCKQQNDQVETLKDLCQTQKETIQMQQEKINAYDEKFARFEAVMSAYMHGNPIGPGSNCQ